MAPQIIYLTLILATLFRVAHMHGKETKVKQNFFVSLIWALIIMFLLYWGGFFKPLFVTTL